MLFYDYTKHPNLEQSTNLSNVCSCQVGRTYTELEVPCEHLVHTHSAHSLRSVAFGVREIKQNNILYSVVAKK